MPRGVYVRTEKNKINLSLAGKDHLEHKTPLSRGGSNEKRNLGVSCQRCNLKKGTKTELEYKEGVQN